MPSMSSTSTTAPRRSSGSGQEADLEAESVRTCGQVRRAAVDRFGARARITRSTRCRSATSARSSAAGRPSSGDLARSRSSIRDAHQDPRGRTSYSGWLRILRASRRDRDGSPTSRTRSRPRMRRSTRRRATPQHGTRIAVAANAGERQQRTSRRHRAAASPWCRARARREPTSDGMDDVAADRRSTPRVEALDVGLVEPVRAEQQHPARQRQQAPGKRRPGSRAAVRGRRRRQSGRRSGRLRQARGGPSRRGSVAPSHHARSSCGRTPTSGEPRPELGGGRRRAGCDAHAMLPLATQVARTRAPTCTSAPPASRERAAASVMRTTSRASSSLIAASRPPRGWHDRSPPSSRLSGSLVLELGRDDVAGPVGELVLAEGLRVLGRRRRGRRAGPAPARRPRRPPSSRCRRRPSGAACSARASSARRWRRSRTGS